MSYTNSYSPPPNDDCSEYLTKEYEFITYEYHDAYNFQQLLNLNWPLSNHSDIMEDYTLKDGSPINIYVIFFNMREKDAKLINHILNHFPGSVYGMFYIRQFLPFEIPV